MTPKKTDITPKMPINIKIADNQEEYITLPAHKTPEGMLSFAMELNEEELKQIQKSKTIYVNIITFNQPMPPIFLAVDPKTFENAVDEFNDWLKRKYREWLLQEEEKQNKKSTKNPQKIHKKSTKKVS